MRDFLTDGYDYEDEDDDGTPKRKPFMGPRRSLMLADVPPATQEPDVTPDPDDAAAVSGATPKGFVSPAFRRSESPAPQLADQQALPPQTFQQPAPPAPQDKQLTPRGPMTPDEKRQARIDNTEARMQELLRPLPKQRLGVKGALVAGIGGFFAGASQPNVAHGGGADLMRGGEAGFQTGMGMVQNAHDRAQAQRLKDAEVAQKSMQALYEAQRPDMDYYKVLAENERARMKRDEDTRNHDFQHADRGAALGVRQQLGDAGLKLRTNQIDLMGNMRAYGQQVGAMKAGLQAPTTADLKAGTAAPVAETDPTKMTIPLQDKHQQAGLMAKYLDAKTGEVRERASMMPDILNIRKQLAMAALSNARNSTERTQIAKDAFKWNYQGLDKDDNPIFDTEDGKVVIPKVEAMNKVPAAMSAKAAMADGVTKAADDIIAKVNQLRDEGVIGPGMGRLQSLKLAVGLSNPEVKALQVALDNMSQLQVPLHGAKGVGMQQVIKDSAGGIAQDPDNLIAAMTEAKRMAGTLGSSNRTIYKAKNRTQNTEGGKTPATPSPGATERPDQGGAQTAKLWYKGGSGKWLQTDVPLAKKAAAIKSGSYFEQPQQ